MNNSVRISVITACFNSANTIGANISSVNSQTYRNIEHVFIDGGSTDGTLEVIAECAGTDHSLLSERDDGIYDALNKGISRSAGDVIGFLHSDDFFAGAGVLAQIAECFEDDDVQAVYGDLQYVSQLNTTQVIRYWRAKAFSYKRLKRGWMPPHPTLYVRKHWYGLIGGLDNQYKIAADYASVLKFFSNSSFKSVYLPQVLVKMRLGGESNRSLGNIIKKSREDYSALKHSGVGGIGTLLAKNVRKIEQFF